MEGTIIVISKVKEVREVLSELMEEQGFSVSGAETGRELLAYIETHQVPSLILYDLPFDLVEASEFCARFQSDPFLSRIPFLILSIYESSLLNHLGISAQGYLLKPIGWKALQKAIKRVILNTTET